MSKIPGFGYSNRSKLRQPAALKRAPAVAPQSALVDDASKSIHSANAVKEFPPDSNHNNQPNQINNSQWNGDTLTTSNDLNKIADSLQQTVVVQERPAIGKGSRLARPNTRIAPAQSNGPTHGAAPYTRTTNIVAPAPIHNVGKKRGTGNVHIPQSQQSLPQHRSRLAGPRSSGTHVLASAKTRPAANATALNEKTITRRGLVPPRQAWTEDSLDVPRENIDRRDARPSSSMLPPRQYSKPGQKLDKKTSQSLQNLPSGRPRTGIRSARSLTGSKENVAADHDSTFDCSKKQQKSSIGLPAPRTKGSRLEKPSFGRTAASRRVVPQVDQRPNSSTPAKVPEETKQNITQSPIQKLNISADNLNTSIDQLSSPVDELSPIKFATHEESTTTTTALNATTIISNANDDVNEKLSQTFNLPSSDVMNSRTNDLDKTRTFSNSFEVVSEQQNTTDQDSKSTSCELLWNITMPEFNDVSSLEGPSSAEIIKNKTIHKPFSDLSYDIIPDSNVASKTIEMKKNSSKFDDDLQPEMREHASSVSTSTPARFLKKERPLARRNTVLGVMNRESPSEMSRASNTSFRPPRQLTIFETDEVGNVEMDYETYHHIYNDVRTVKTLLLKLKRELQESDVHSPLSKQLALPYNVSNKKTPLGKTLSSPPTSPSRPGMRPKAFSDVNSSVVETNRSRSTENDEKCNTTTENASNATDDQKRSTDAIRNETDKTAQDGQREDFQWRRNVEELQHELESKDFTIKLLQTQLEKNDFCEEMESLQEENILLRVEMQQLQEKFEKLSSSTTLTTEFCNGESSLNNHQMTLTKSDIGTMRKMYADSNDEFNDV